MEREERNPVDPILKDVQEEKGVKGKRELKAAGIANGFGFVGKALKTEAFIQSIVKLFVQAIVIGVIAPLSVFFYKDFSRSVERASELKRIQDETIVAAKKQLLDEVTRLIWQYESLALDITFYKQPEVKNEKLYEAALKRYNEQITQFVIDLRTQISRARYLCSNKVAQKTDVAQEIEDFLNNTIFPKQDRKINEYVLNTKTDAEWVALHNEFKAIYPEVKDLISELVASLDIIDLPLQATR